MHQTLQGWSKKRWDRPSCWSPGGDYFLFLAGPGGSRNGWALSEKKSIWQKIKPEPVQLTYGPMEFYDFTFSPDGKKLYGVGEITQGELCKLDIQTGQLKLFLEGISAMYVDFSRENDRITYVSYPDRHLWRSRADGSQKLQLVNSMHVRQPRWSPDGKQIVFQSPQVGKDMLYLIGSEGGTPRPLLPGGLRGDAPNWSPDGTGIVFGTYPNDVKQSPMKISILDMKTGRISDVKGSDGFANPQWSPDGKCLVAAVLNSLELMMFDFKTDEWSLLDKGPAVYHKWSRDGKYIYAYRLTAPIALYRIDVTKRRAETIVDLSNANYVEFWMGLSSNDEPLLLRDLSTQEIYAFDWIAP
jgi:tricorn protease-like protein